jgi:serine/threonine protein kinase
VLGTKVAIKVSSGQCWRSLSASWQLGPCRRARRLPSHLPALSSHRPLPSQVLKADAAASVAAADFRAEADTLAQLRHPHVLLLLGTCDEGGHRALVTELAEGGSLHDALFGAGGGPRQLAWRERVRVAQETAAGLAYLHSCAPPIVHRDVKPASILLTRCAVSLGLKGGPTGSCCCRIALSPSVPIS